MDRNTRLISQGTLTADEISRAFARYGNAPPGLGQIIVTAGNRTGMNSDFLACQIADETRWWTSDDATLRNNPSGFGHTDGAPVGDRFPDLWAGINATVAHWLTYILGDGNPLAADDPRFALVPAAHRGVARTIGDIGGGVWASAIDYPQAILNRYKEFLDNGALSGTIINGGTMNVILSAGHLNIGAITDAMGIDPAALRTATGALGTEATPNEAVVRRAAGLLAAAGVNVLTTDACYHPEVYAEDADLCVFVHHDGVSFASTQPQRSGAVVVHSGPSDVATDDRAQLFVEAWKRRSPAITGIADMSTSTSDMLEYYGGRYRTAATPAALVECSVWGGSDGQRTDVDTDKEGDALALAIADYLGVTIDGQILQGGGATGGGGTGDQPGSGGAGGAVERTWPLAGGAFTAAALVDTGDGRGVTIRDNGAGLEFWIGHGFFDEWIAGGDLADPGAAFESAIERDGAPLTVEYTSVAALIRGGQPTTVQWFERARYEWDPDSGVVRRGRVGAEAMGRFQGALPVGSGHAA